MYQGHRYIDADSHVLEPSDLWERYLEPRFRRPMPRSIVEYAGDPLAFRVQVVVGDQGMPYGPEGSNTPLAGLDEVYAEYAQKGFSPACYRDAMERTGIDYMVVYPTAGLYVNTVPVLDAEVAAAYRRAYNNWLHDFAEECGGRVIGAGAVDLRDAREAAREARRCVRQLGFKAIMINPEPVTEYRLSDPFYEPLWDELEELDVPLAIHVGAGNAAEIWLQHYFPRLQFASTTSTFTIGNMLASMTLIVGGVLERHPRLRVVHLESGAGWVGFWLDRMESSAAGGFRGMRIDGLSLSPVEYFRRQCFISADPDDPGIRSAIEVIGDDAVVTATDFGHPEGRGWVHAISDTLAQPIPDESKRKIMWDNSLRLYDLEDRVQAR
jgi:predicted TIM-barrel fold metal-dependent hydrolase